MLLNKLKIYLCFIFISYFAIIACFSQVISDNEKIKTFYKYDSLFYFGWNEKDTSIEVGSQYELLSINDIDKQYQKITKQYVDILGKFINSNFDLLKKLNKVLTDFSIDKETTNKVIEDTRKVIKDKLLPALPGAIRCMIAIQDIQYIEVAVKIDNNEYAITMNPKYGENVYWTAYLMGGQPTKLPREEVIDDQGVIKYHEWFYESNMKIRIVKQIRDKDGKYYGEIYTDYYKLDQYDKLFDKKGNPKK